MFACYELYDKQVPPVHEMQTMPCDMHCWVEAYADGLTHQRGLTTHDQTLTEQACGHSGGQNTV